MLALLRARPAYRRLFLAHAVSRAGDALNTVALVVLVFRLTGSGTGVATTVAFEVAPVLLLGPVAGALADRFPRRRVMVGADVGRAALAGLLAAVHGEVAVAYVVAFGLATGALVFNPAAAALVPDTVEDDERVDANAALWTVAVLSQILLAPLAGLLIATVGVGWAFGLNAASYLVSAALLRGLTVGTTPAAIHVRGWRSVLAGVDAVRSSTLLGRLVVMQVLAALSAGATSGLLVVLASDWLRVGPSGFGALLGAIGVGAASGPLLLRRFIRPSDPRWLFGPYAVRGAVDLVLAGAASPVVAAGALALYGVGTSTGTVAYQSTLQSEVPDAVRGRAFALFDVAWNASRLVSLGLGGVLADRFGVRTVYVIGGVLLLAAAAWGAAGTRSLLHPRPARRLGPPTPTVAPGRDEAPDRGRRP